VVATDRLPLAVSRSIIVMAMAAQSLWLVVEQGSTPASHVARRTLRKRLDAVWTELAAAAGDRPAPERVHRLRVATRRTLAALEVFAGLLPERRCRWFQKRLRRLRRAAGEARDLDVLSEHIGRDSVGGSPLAPAQVARERLVTMLARRRDASRAPICRIRDELVAANWLGRTERLLDDIGSRGRDRAFATHARRTFRPLVRRFFTKADRRLRSADDIHRLRIEGKKLRYAMEIFACVFPPRRRARTAEALERLQVTLGEFTDHAAAADRFRRWERADGAAAARHTIADLRARETEAADRARRAFTKWWSPSRRRWLRRKLERTLRRRTA
jgi:CHAD domain-containing protein